MKRTILLAIICIAMLSLISLSTAEVQIIKSYEGNLTEKAMQSQINLVTLSNVFGVPAFAMAETCKFTAPKPGWKLTGANIFGFDGYNGTAKSMPVQRVIALEVRDKNFNLLYRMADVQIPYTNFLLNVTGPMMFNFELPSIQVSDDFFICFYDRGVRVGFEMQNKSTNSSFIFSQAEGILDSARLPIGQNNTTPVNWIMSVVGK